jgi:hypothetical protein
MRVNELASPLSRVTQGKAKLIDDDRGRLGVIDLPDCVPFVPVRTFWISGVQPGGSRGGHAHKACSQFFVCLSGRIHVDAFDGSASRGYLLGRGDFLNVVPGIFATEIFLDQDSILLVLCDRPYEQDDYIHDREMLKRSAKG